MRGNINSSVEKNVQEVETMKANTVNNKGAETMKTNATNNNVEVETMANENVKNMNPGKAGAQNIEEAPFDFTELIPADEQAVAETNPIREDKLVVVNTIEPLMDMTSEISEEEQEAVEALPVKLTQAAKYGCFTPAVNMRGFVTSTGHIIYAKICIKSKSNKVIQYCQQYSNNEYSKVIEVNTADLFMASIYRFMTQTISETVVKRNVTEFLLKANRDYYDSLLYPQENIKVVSILNLLMGEYDNMPVENRISILEQPEKLYGRVMQIIKKECLNLVDEHDSYHTLWKDQMDIIAQRLGIKTLQLLKKLKEYHFLYLTESSEGYQTCVRFKSSGEFFQTSHTEWCYCILKLENLAKKRMQKLEK